METRNLQPSRNGALVDLVDRILVKGVILHADVIISVSGVPLIGVNLKAAIAGLTTMVDYGMMGTWDEQIRKSVLAESKEEAPLDENEVIVLKTFGSHYCRDKFGSGIWRSGFLYVTNKRLFLFRKNPSEILFETALDRIKALSVDVNENSEGENRLLRVLIKKDHLDNEIALLRTIDVDALKSKLIEETRGTKETEKCLVSVS
jgi:Gas vesicle protein